MNPHPRQPARNQHQSLISEGGDETPGDRFLRRFFFNPLGRAFLYVEAWFNLAFGTALNPFYHLGSLVFFFLWIVLVSGIYLYIFFDTSIVGSYQSIESLTHGQWYLGGVMRSLHRYASDAAVVVTVLHILREFALGRYRGFRWFSWFTGVPPLWVMVLLGVTGYWLVWDQVAQYVAVSSARLMDALPLLSNSMTRNFLSGKLSDRFFTLMTLIHLVGGPITLVFALWIHVKRLSNVDPMGPRGLAIGSLLALIVLSLVKPALSLGPADMSKVPVVLNIDWFYLNAFPLLNHWSEGAVWVLILGLSLLLALLPWLPPRRMPAAARVRLDHCNGCGQCFLDCPFDAISMRKRSDGAHWATEAVVNPDLCASCGICVGSCPSSNPFRRADERLTTGIDMPQVPIHETHAAAKAALSSLKGETRLLIFGCNHGVNLAEIHDPGIATMTFSCIGMLPAGFIDYALKNGADGVMISGCRSSDCYYRFGNRWMEQRLSGGRMPHLRKNTDRSHLHICWAAGPDKDHFLRELKAFRRRLSDERQR